MFKLKNLLFYTLLAFYFLLTGCTLFRKKGTVPAPPVTASTPVNSPVVNSVEKAAFPPYAHVLGGNIQADSGFITVLKKGNTYFFEVPDSMLKREILIVSRVSKAAAGMHMGDIGYAGDQIGEGVYRFEKGPENQLFLLKMSFAEYAKDSTMALFPALEKNNMNPIVASFPILTIKKDSSAYVIDVTNFLKSDNDILYFQHKGAKNRLGLGGEFQDRGYLKYVRAYSKNIEIGVIKTYGGNINATVALNSSMVLLPLKPMRGRLQDKRVGYITNAFKDFGSNPQGVGTTTYIRRFRLAPKPEDLDKYLMGELVEPAKQIVFYIDPVTPKKWIPYLIAGVNDWQKAFESAGFKNAIIGKEAPTKEQDSTWSIDDAAHSAIMYLPSSEPNAITTSVADPRSGEVIESHIFWHHNLMSLLKKWYMLQAGAVDSRARKYEFDDELMGNLIRVVSSHEVGHSLGLLHNFGSSATVPVEKLRDKAWVEKHGHTPSIMDYARFNYVAQPEDHISEKGIFPRIGEYDKWAIKWGYTFLPVFSTPELEQTTLTRIATDSLNRNHRLWYGQEKDEFDPRSQDEDLGDDAVKASTYGIKNLKRISDQFYQWLSVPGESTENLKEANSELWSQFGRYVSHVLKNIGGSYHTQKINSEPGNVYENVPYEKQRASIRFLNEEVFTTPLWLNNERMMNRLGLSFGTEVKRLQENIINELLSPRRLGKMLENEQAAKNKIYTVTALFSDLNKGIFKELYAGKNVGFYRRNLQKNYCDRLLLQVFSATDTQFTATDLRLIIREQLRIQQRLFQQALKDPGLNKLTQLHLKEMNAMIRNKFSVESGGFSRL